MVFSGCAETVNAARKHSNGVGRKIFLTNSGSGFTRVLNALSLRILWRRRWLGRIGVLLSFISLQHSLRVLCLFLLELLECGHGLLRVGHAMEVAIGDAKLVPGLFDDFRIGALSRCSAFKMLSGSGVIAKKHFSAAKIVVRVAESGL